jgi:hypothetical protein
LTMASPSLKFPKRSILKSPKKYLNLPGFLFRKSTFSIEISHPLPKRPYPLLRYLQEKPHPMNIAMRFSFSSLLLVLLLVLTGAAFILLSTWELFRIETIHFILNYPRTLLFIGAVLIFTAFAIAYIRRRSAPIDTITLGGGELVTEISDVVLKRCLEPYFSSIFKNRNIRCHVELFQDRIAISAFIPDIPLEEQKVKLEQLDRDLPWFIAKKTGLTRPIELSLFSTKG